MDDVLERLSVKKRRLDNLKPLPKELTESLEAWFRVELTYSSNAIEGNTLSRIETAEVIDKGPSAVISGKALRDQLEAINHAKAIGLIKDLAKIRNGHQFITEQDIKSIHQTILTGINDYWAGKYRQTEIFLRGSDVEFPPPTTISRRMREFTQWLEGQQEEHPVRVAAAAHYRLATIHPFVDGNGRTARLLMNLILLLNGYPMAIIQNEERIAYLKTFEIARKQNDLAPFYKLIEKSVERSLDLYIRAAVGKPVLSAMMKKKEATKKLLKIGELAKEAGETVHTIRFWTKEGLLKIEAYTRGGYQLYNPSMIKRVKEIRRLQDEKRLTVNEMKKLLVDK